ncbi:MAG: PAS domain S-box protein, partial [Spirochaetaceae bacterium]
MFENSELYREIINSIPDIIFRTDENDLIQFINAAANILGYSPDQLECMPLETIIHADDMKRIPAFMADKRKSMEVRLLPKKSTKQPLADDEENIIGELSVMAVLPGSVAGQLSGDGFVGIIRDITRRRKAEELLRKLLS